MTHTLFLPTHTTLLHSYTWIQYNEVSVFGLALLKTDFVGSPMLCILSKFWVLYQKDKLNLYINVVNTFKYSVPPFLNLDKIKVHFDKLNNTDLFLQSHGFI